MKANKVSALRKRGLRCDVSRGAEPPIEAVPQLTDTNPNNQEQLSNIERKTDTMKTYILRTAQPVEPQKTPRSPRPKPAAPVTTAAWLERPAVTPQAEARTLLNAKNESFRQPVLNRQIARTYLAATDSAMATRIRLWAR
jgi:hypothetical protein